MSKRDTFDRRDGDHAVSQGRNGLGHGTGDASVSKSAPVPPPNASALSDIELARAYQRIAGQSGDTNADALRAEIDRRGLDV